MQELQRSQVYSVPGIVFGRNLIGAVQEVTISNLRDVQGGFIPGSSNVCYATS